MVRSIVLAGVLASSFGIAAAAPKYVSTAPGQVAVLDEDQFGALSLKIHEEEDHCGGYMVYDTAEEALAAPAPEKTLTYTIDRGPLVRAILPALSDAKILQTIKTLSSYKNRYYLSESGAAVSYWLADRWRGFAKDRPDATVELMDHGYAQKSVILTIPGTTKKDEVVVIGGHIDSIGRGGKDANAPGADDDASGIATLDEVARVLLENDYRPERTIKFMAYAAEEVGLRGSLSVVKAYQKAGINVVGALQLDMTNYQGSDRDIWLIDDYTSKAQNKFVADLIETYTSYTWGSDKCGYACSDHASWHRAGVPASAPHETRSKDRNRNIHTNKDTLEVSGNNAKHAVKFAAVGAAYAIELAKGELGPRVTTDDEPHMLTATSYACHQRDVRDLPDSDRTIALVGALLGLLALLGLTRRV
ncbi:MAG TPA: M20/M25/M40 family metallo-hydrolase [Kofleriaceae bacterium]|jgi:leucyl aminopeptidase